MVYLVLELLATGVPIEEIIGEKYYPQLKREHIQAALQYAAQVTEVGELVEFAA